LSRGRGRGLFSRKHSGGHSGFSDFTVCTRVSDPIYKHKRPPHPPTLKEKEKTLVDKEVQQMLEKTAIERVENSSKNQYLSSIFLFPKKDLGYRPVINLWNLNRHIPFQHFKMENLSLLKELIQKGDFMIKIDLKDAYFSVPLNKDSQKYVRFQWKGKIYQFLCLCFGLGPAPRVFTKLLKVPIALMRRLKVRLIIYLDDCLILASTLGEAEVARDTLIFILEHLGFQINFRKSVLQPKHLIQFLGIEIDSNNLKLLLPQEKLVRIVSHCKELLAAQKVSVRDLMKIIGRLKPNRTKNESLTNLSKEIFWTIRSHLLSSTYQEF